MGGRFFMLGETGKFLGVREPCSPGKFWNREPLKCDFHAFPAGNLQNFERYQIPYKILALKVGRSGPIYITLHKNLVR